MEFDKSKILTVVTADQAKKGQRGWVACTLESLIEKIASNEQPVELLDVLSSSERRFRTEKGNVNFGWSIFYPAPESTYAERQAEWVRDNDVKVGTKVRFTKGFDADEDGSECCEHRDAKGKEGFVNEIFDTYLSVVLEGDCWMCTFTALEIVKEPTYRPFKNAEEFKPYRDEWFVSKCDNSKSSSVNVQNYSNIGVILLRKVTKNDDVVFDLCRWDEFFTWFVRENGEPCGVREEA